MYGPHGQTPPSHVPHHAERPPFIPAKLSQSNLFFEEREGVWFGLFTLSPKLVPEPLPHRILTHHYCTRVDTTVPLTPLPFSLPIYKNDEDSPAIVGPTCPIKLFWLFLKAVYYVTPRIAGAHVLITRVKKATNQSSAVCHSATAFIYFEPVASETRVKWLQVSHKRRVNAVIDGCTTLPSVSFTGGYLYSKYIFFWNK